MRSNWGNPTMPMRLKRVLIRRFNQPQEKSHKPWISARTSEFFCAIVTTQNTWSWNKTVSWPVQSLIAGFHCTSLKNEIFKSPESRNQEENMQRPSPRLRSGPAYARYSEKLFFLIYRALYGARCWCPSGRKLFATKAWIHLSRKSWKPSKIWINHYIKVFN